MKKFSSQLLSFMLIVILMFSFSTTAFAASGSKVDPYGYTWLDETNGTWYFQYYEYDSSDKVYSVVDYAYLKGNKLYDKNSKLISSNIRAMDDDTSLETSPTVAFYKGYLYFITNDGDVCRMSSSTASTYSKASDVSNAKTFTLDADWLGHKVGSKKLTSMTFSGSYERGSDSSGNTGNVTQKKGNYVLTSAFPGDPTKLVYDAYYNDELFISVHCKNANVWLETEQLLLSETCVGAKFVGYSHDYFTILYDQDGTVYAFAYGDYQKALPISLGEEIMSYKKDSNGFIESITTSKNTYNLDKLLDDYGYDDVLWKMDVSYVENSTTKSVAYNESDEALAKVKKSNNYLYFGDTKLKNSYKCTYFGFTEDSNPVWINRNGELYYYENGTTYLVQKNVTRLRYDADGFAYEYKVGTKTYSIDF